MNLNLCVGIIAIIASVISIIVVVLTRHNIVDILDKDVILFDKNFEIKKAAISEALMLVDKINKEGKDIIVKPEFKAQAENCYNDLICVVSKMKLAEEFYAIALDINEEVTQTRLAQFKLLCRHDIGLKTSGAKIVKRVTETLDVENRPAKTEKLEKTNFGAFEFSEPQEKIPVLEKQAVAKPKPGRPKKK